jgi:hypothetical protein
MHISFALHVFSQTHAQYAEFYQGSLAVSWWFVCNGLVNAPLLLNFFFQWFFQAIQGPVLLFSSIIIFTDDRTPWMRDQPIARPVPKHMTTQTQNKHIHTPNIHALNVIRTHDPSVRASEDSLCLCPRGYCDRLCYCMLVITTLYLCSLLYLQYFSAIRDHHQVYLMIRMNCYAVTIISCTEGVWI